LKQTVYVISDLHLGGEAANDQSPGFQICGEASQKLLVDFLEWVATQRRADHDIHLVVNGDSVDFLAEKPFAAFTVDENEAERKLEAIFDRTRAVWDGFQNVAGSGAQVTFTLGNHDLELTLPGPRRLLRDTLGPGRVDFLFDNEALRIGSVLIEHGNRYDGWNAVNHDSLRRVRSALSRGEKPENFPAPPGSRLVVEVMNDLKRKYRFIDLLKPEQESVVPLLVALEPATLAKIARVRQYRKQALAVRYADDGRPEDSEMIAARRATVTREKQSEDKAASIALAAGVDLDQIGMGAVAAGLLDRWRAATDGDKRQAEVRLAYEALQQWLGPHFTAFDTQLEDETYLLPARTSLRNGFDTVIYGHTHLVKRLSPLGANDLYLNTGTWAELMAVPRAILLDNEDDAKRQLEEFLDDLAANKLDKWKRLLPTFAKIEMDGTKTVTRDVYLYQGRGEYNSLTNGRLVPSDS
jgi:UDP-2,3-diacylglucosamine pyrophosphatase LpxH